MWAHITQKGKPDDDTNLGLAKPRFGQNLGFPNNSRSIKFHPIFDCIMHAFNLTSWFSMRDNSNSTLSADNWHELFAFQRKFRSKHKLTAPTLLEKLDLQKSMA